MRYANPVSLYLSAPIHMRYLFLLLFLGVNVTSANPTYLKWLPYDILLMIVSYLMPSGIACLNLAYPNLIAEEDCRKEFLKACPEIYCKKKFAFRAGLDKHNLTPYIIAIGKAVGFATQARLNGNALEADIISLGIKKLYGCHLCKVRCDKLSDVKKHIKDHFKEPLNCPSCEKTYLNKGPFENHIINKHPEIIPYNCQTCSIGFWFEDSLSEHIKERHTTQNLYCEICEKDFTRKASYSQHMNQNHFFEKLRCCFPDCKKKYKNKKSIKKHYETHPGNKPFKCKLCTATFWYEENVKSHERLPYRFHK
jgi:uncharacterized C2H2 Zn-finger protein